MLLFQFPVQLRLILTERLLVGASGFQLLGQVAVRDLLFVQLSAGELEAVLGNLEFRLQFLDLAGVILLELCYLLLVLFFGLGCLRFIALLEHAHLLLVVAGHLCQQGLVVVFDDDERLVDL